MWIIRSLGALALLIYKTPVVWLSLFLCLGALSKTIEASFINSLPMNNVTHKVFSGLEYLALGGFCFQVFRYVLIYEVGSSIIKLVDHLKRK
jgi:hypothetical protein